MPFKKKVLPHLAEGSNQDSKRSALPKSWCRYQWSSYDQAILKSSPSSFASATNHFKEEFHFISLNQTQVNAAHHWEGEKE